MLSRKYYNHRVRVNTVAYRQYKRKEHLNKKQKGTQKKGNNLYSQTLNKKRK